MRSMKFWAILFAGALPASATAEQVAFLGIESRSASDEVRERIDRATQTALESNGDVLIDSGDSTMPDLLLLVGCSTISDSCLTDLASALDAESIVYGSLVAGDDALSLALIRFSVRDTGSDVDATFDVHPFVNDDEALLVDVIGAIVGGRSVLRVFADGEATVAVDAAAEQPAPATFTSLFPGPHEVVATRGNAQAVRTIELGVGEVLTVSMPSSSFERVRSASGDAPPRHESDGGGLGRRQVAGIGLAAFGLGATAAGVAFGLHTQALQSDFDAETRQRQAHELADDGSRSAVLTNVAFGVGAASLGAGIWLLVSGRGGDEVALTPWGPAGPGATVGARF